MSDTLLIERHESVAILTLNRPQQRNALSTELRDAISSTLAAAAADDSISVAVITGNGPVFCAGFDLKEFDKTPMQEIFAGESSVRYHQALRTFPKPLIAAVNGAAVGIGMTMILPFDVIVASDKAKFGMLFIKVGLVPELASTHFLVQRMGFGRASEMCLSGRLYPASEAYQGGLVDVLTTADDLVAKAFAIADGIAANPDPQLRMTKQLLTENGSATDLSAVQERESVLLRECWKSAEHKEAVSAFLEKRPPRFRA